MLNEVEDEAPAEITYEHTLGVLWNQLKCEMGVNEKSISITSTKKLFELMTLLLKNPSITILEWVYSLIQKHPFIIAILEQKPHIISNLSIPPPLSEILSHLYFKYITNDPLLSIITSILTFITSHIDIHITTYKYVYKQLALYYKLYTHKSYLSHEFPITKQICLKHFTLLEILYKTIPTTNVDDEQSSSTINNYLYFSNPSQVNIQPYDGVSSDNMQVNTANGFIIAMKIYIDYEVDESVLLASIECTTQNENKHAFINTLELYLESKPLRAYVNVKDTLKGGDVEVPMRKWVVLKVKVVSGKYETSSEIQLKVIEFENQTTISNKQKNEIAGFNNITQISPLTLFKNFQGRISSFLIYTLNPNHSNKSLLSLVTSDYEIKAYNLQDQFIINNNNPSDAKPQKKKKFKIKSNKQTNLLSNHISHNILMYFLPSYVTYSRNKETIYIEDIRCRFIGTFSNDLNESPYANGVMLYNDITQNLLNIGGIYVLCPLMEIIFVYRDIVLNEDSLVFEKYLHLIFKLWEKSLLNVNEISKDYFISTLYVLFDSLTLKHPIEITSPLIQTISNVLGNLKNTDFDKVRRVLINMLLSPNFLSKFQINSQIYICSCVYENKRIKDISFYEQMHKLLPKFFEIIKTQDNKNYYCCIEHRNIFKYEHINKYCSNDNYLQDISTEKKDLIKHVIQIIESVFEHNVDKSKIEVLLNFMCGDFSPCVSNKLLGIIANLFTEQRMKKGDFKKKESGDNDIIGNNLLYVLLWYYENGLPDTKVKVIKLIKDVIYKHMNTKYEKGNSENKNKLKSDLRNIFGYIEMSIVYGGLKISNKYLCNCKECSNVKYGLWEFQKKRSKSIINSTKLNIENKEEKKLKNKRRKSFYLNINTNDVYNNLIYIDDNDIERESIDDDEKKNKFELNITEDTSGDMLQTNPTPPTPDGRISSNKNRSSKERQPSPKTPITPSSPNPSIKSAKTLKNSPVKNASPSKDNARSSSGGRTSKNPQPLKESFIVYFPNKRLLPLHYFTNPTTYSKLNELLFEEIHSWLLSNKDFLINKNSLDKELFSLLLSLLTKIATHSNSLILIDKFCDFIGCYFLPDEKQSSDIQIFPNTKPLLENNIDLWLFETLFICTLTKEYKYNSLLTVNTPGDPTKIINLIVQKTIILLTRLIKKERNTSEEKNNNVNALSDLFIRLISHSLYLKTIFLQNELVYLISKLLTKIFLQIIRDLKNWKVASMLALFKAIYFCISNFECNNIPNILLNPYSFNFKLQIMNNVWIHNDILLKLVNKLFFYITGGLEKVIEKNIINQLEWFDNNNSESIKSLHNTQELDTFVKNIINISRNKLLDDNAPLISVFQLYISLIVIYILYISENSMKITLSIQNNFQKIFFILIVFSVQRFEENEQDPISGMLISFYVLLSKLVEDKIKDLTVVFDNITSLLSLLSKESLPKQKKLFSKFALKDKISKKSPLSRFLSFFANILENPNFFSDFTIENKDELMKTFYLKISTEIDNVYNKYIIPLFTFDIYEICHDNSRLSEYSFVFYYFKGLISKPIFSNKRMTPFYIRKSICSYRQKINYLICDKILKYEEIENANNTTTKLRGQRKKYKKIKKDLFSWNSFWSDHNIFYKKENRYMIKYKLLNHITSDFMRPLIIPIIDIDYYLPTFTNFQIRDLFEKNITDNCEAKQDKEIYAVNLNIRKIFLDKNKSISSLHRQSLVLSHLMHKDLRKNVLLFRETIQQKKLLKKEQSSQGNKQFQLSNMADEDTELNCLASAILLQAVIQLKTKCYCCFVKHSNHIPGQIKIDTLDHKQEKKYLLFYPMSKEEREEDKKFQSVFSNRFNFDCERKTCFGSVFPISKKDGDHSPFTISIEDIKFIFKRNYFYQNTALEIYTYKNKCFYFKFINQQERNLFFDSFIIVMNALADSSDYIKTPQEIKIPNRGKKIKEFNSGDTDIIGYFIPNTSKSNSTICITSPIELHKKWVKYEISTFNFIMWTNILGNRSYIDTTQYPVFPWVIQEYYSDKFDLNENSNYRDLTLPMGMIIPKNESERAKQRKHTFINTYNLMINDLREEFSMEIIDEDEDDNNNEDDDLIEDKKKFAKDEKVFTLLEKKKKTIDYDLIPYHYGSHYSNSLYINHYLMRLFPFASILIEIQGNKFDNPQRLFYNLSYTFSSASSQKSDVRELCPEFYYSVQMFMNVNNFNFGKVERVINENEKQIHYIRDVQLPKWTNGSACKFIETQRIVLEEYTPDISYWIDLVFGSRQKGKQARKNKNLFMPYSYEGELDLSKFDKENLQIYLRLAEMGSCPIIVYYNTLKERGKLSNELDVMRSEKFNQINKNISILKDSKYEPVLYSYDVEVNAMFVIFSDFSRGKIMLNGISGDGSEVNCVITHQSPLYENNISKNKNSVQHNKFVLLQKIMRYHSYGKIYHRYQNAYAIYNKGENVVVGGFWDGSLILIDNDNKIQFIMNPSYDNTNNNKEDKEWMIPQNKCTFDISPIVYICISKDNLAAYCGSLRGTIFYFSIENNIKWQLINIKRSHSNAISYINMNNTLNMIATIGEDNYIFLYTTPLLEITTSLYFENSDDFIPDYIFLSATPVPCFAVYCISKGEFQVYDINGTFMHAINETKTGMISPLIATSVLYRDYLIYSNDDNEIVIRRFPYMEENAKKETIQQVNEIRYIALGKDEVCLYVIGNSSSFSVLKVKPDDSN